jgi:hypothetical protein
VDTVESSPPYQDHDLVLTKREGKPTRVNGTVLDPDTPPSPYGYQYEYRYENWSATRTASYLSGGVPWFPAVNWSYYKTKALANLNGRFGPKVDIPLFLFELRDLPRMLRDLGRFLNGDLSPRDVPSSFLSYNFGWAPLVSDLLSLLDLSNSIDRTLELILASGNGRKIKGSLAKLEDLNYDSDYPIHHHSSTSKKLTTRTRASYYEKGWYTARLSISDKAQLAELRETLRANDWRPVLHATGLNRINASTVWESIPWSWLIDYFLNVGDVIEANLGQMPYDVKSLNLMVKQTIDETEEVVENTANLSIDPHRFLFTRKNRQVHANPTPSFAFTPFLTEGQKKILSALALARILS